MTTTLPKVTVYSDGGATPNPGPGGWGVVILHPDQAPKELSGGDPNTTNNRMELMAAIQALESLPAPSQVDFHIDSQYVKNGITKWIHSWIREGKLSVQSHSLFGDQPKSDVLNADLWQRLYHAQQRHLIEWHWVRGHTGVEYNERADQLATAAIPRPKITVDNDQTKIIVRVSGPEKVMTGRFAWAALIQRPSGTEELSGVEEKSSANLIYLQATLAILASLPADEAITFYTNNSYLYDGITQWVKGWRKGDWAKPDKFKTEWQTLDRENQKRTIRWVMAKPPNIPEGFEAAAKLAQERRDRA